MLLGAYDCKLLPATVKYFTAPSLNALPSTNLLPQLVLYKLFCRVLTVTNVCLENKKGFHELRLHINYYISYESVNSFKQYFYHPEVDKLVHDNTSSYPFTKVLSLWLYVKMAKLFLFLIRLETALKVYKYALSIKSIVKHDIIKDL